MDSASVEEVKLNKIKDQNTQGVKFERVLVRKDKTLHKVLSDLAFVEQQTGTERLNLYEQSKKNEITRLLCVGLIS